MRGRPTLTAGARRPAGPTLISSPAHVPPPPPPTLLARRRAAPPPPAASPAPPPTPFTTRLELAPDGRVAFTDGPAVTSWREEEEEGTEGGTSTPATRPPTASVSSSSSDDEADEPPEADPSSAETEALAQLEWGAVCYQVARLCRTVRGARAAAFGGLTLGTTRAESAAALATTAEAARLAALEPAVFWGALTGVIDIARLLDDLEPGAAGGVDGADDAADAPPPSASSSSTFIPGAATPLIVATPLGILATADTLEAAARLEAGLAPHAADHPHVSALVAACGVAGLTPLRTILRTAMPAGGGARLADAACPALAAARAARAEAETAAREAATRWARTLHAAGAAERPAVAVRRGRLCVAVLAARRGGHLPKGSVTLAASGSGATLYAEPAPLVPLNNAAAAARAGVEAAEAAVLARLSAAVGAEAPAIRASLAALEALDHAGARAAHAAWCGGVRPRLLAREEAATGGAARIAGLLHPLLLERALPQLPDPPGLSPDEEGEDGDAPPAGPPPRAAPPRGVAWLVPPRTGVVTITGPNTGGKTAALKALGLAALMARAGLFLPVEKPAGDATSTPVECAIAWFSPILADIGDAQSLDASLSTFSGSVRRAARALAAAGPDALALLDEVGSGTDPAEGAALAGALLDALAGATALTVATTHHASLKGDTRPGRADAAVEFDTARLAPTYRLLWGSAGASSALDVAEGLGYDSRLVKAARLALQNARGGAGLGVAALAAAVVGAGGASTTSTAEPALPAGLSPADDASSQPAASSPPDVRAALEAGAAVDLEAARAAAARAAADRAAAEAEAAAAEAELEELRKAAAASGKAPLSDAAAAAAARDAGRDAAVAALADLEWTLAAHARGELSDEEAAACVAETRARAPDARTAAARLAGARAGGWTAAEGDAPPAIAPEGWTLAVGDTVAVPAMGGVAGTVVQTGGGRVRVRVGRAVVSLGPGDVVPLTAEQAAAAKAGGTKKPLIRAPAPARVSPPGPAIRTPSNTLNLIGSPAAGAATAVENFLGRVGDEGDALFIVHGVGSVRRAVREALKTARGVASFDNEPGGDPGVTMLRVGKRR